MNTLAYSTQKPEKVGPRIEEKIRGELGAVAPLSYTVEEGEAGSTSTRRFLSDVAKAFIGGATNALFTLDFDLGRPRPTYLGVTVNRQGVGSYVGHLLYAAELSKPIGGEARLDDEARRPHFVGDPAVSARLNESEDALKAIAKLIRDESTVGGMRIEARASCWLLPSDSGSRLVVSTLPKPVRFGMSAIVDAKAFLEAAEAVEAAL
jgi:hypothetical protein